MMSGKFMFAFVAVALATVTFAQDEPKDDSAKGSHEGGGPGGHHGHGDGHHGHFDKDKMQEMMKNAKCTLNHFNGKQTEMDKQIITVCISELNLPITDQTDHQQWKNLTRDQHTGLQRCKRLKYGLNGEFNSTAVAVYVDNQVTFTDTNATIHEAVLDAFAMCETKHAQEESTHAVDMCEFQAVGQNCFPKDMFPQGGKDGHQGKGCHHGGQEKKEE